MKARAFPLLLSALALPALAAQERASITGLLEWDRMELSAVVSVNLEKAGIRFPAGRARAESLLEDEYESLIRSPLMAIQVDSAATAAQKIESGELTVHDADNAVESARRIPPSLSADLASIAGRYTLSLNQFAAEFPRGAQPNEAPSPLVPVPAREYTGIIIIADETVPVHGRQARALPRPCLFPKIWDSEMNLVFDRGMTRPDLEWGMVRYASRESIMGAAPSGIAESLAGRVGENPLRIIARGVFGIAPTDPVIHRDDALLILSNETNRRLLREGRVVIIVEKSALKAAF
ncbi:MAG: polymerase [Treponema sp.]|jgi:hypothetical protein|nr:polymerase [Treponema sp.]